MREMKTQTSTDMPQPQTTEERLRQLEAKYEALQLRTRLAEQLTDASIDCVFALDTAFRVTAWNSACEAYTGISREDITGQGFFDVFANMREHGKMRLALEHALQGHKSFVPAGRPFFMEGHFESHIVPLKEEDGSVTGILMVIHDVAHRVKAETALKSLNRQLGQQYEELQRANSELATFTHITSHDLKEPLRKIYVFVETVLVEEAGKLSDRGRANMRRIQSSVQRLGLLADSMVTFAGIHDASQESVPLTATLQEAVEQLAGRIRETEARISWDELPVIRGSQWQLRLLFQHLLGNAIKFQPPGQAPVVGIDVATGLPAPEERGETGGDLQYIRLSVRDNGIGIAPQYHQQIFNLFTRLHDKTEYPGVGLGLALCRKIVEKHGGFMTVDSEPGAGAVFHCYLPEERVES